jgi:hypothetical protein
VDRSGRAPVLDRSRAGRRPVALHVRVRQLGTVHPIEGGKTARQVLAEQLDLLRVQMDEVADAVARNDTDSCWPTAGSSRRSSDERT